MNSMGHVWLGKKQFFSVITLVILFFIVQAGASAAYSTNDEIQVDVVSGSLSGSIIIKPSDYGFNWNDVFNNPGTKYNWYLPVGEDFDIMDATDTVKLAHVSQLSFAVKGDPVMDFGFSVDAFAEGTAFTISSPSLTFSEILNPSEVEAYSQVNATGGTTKLTGNLPGGKVYRAAYNAGGVFADLVDSPLALSTGAGGEIGTEDTGVGSIAGGVTSMQGIYSFSLWEDLVPNPAALQAAAVSEYSIVVPEPATLALLGLGALLLRRRKA